LKRGQRHAGSPSLEASVHVRGLRVAREFTGLVDIDAHTQGRALELHMNVAPEHITSRAETPKRSSPATT